MKIRSKITLSLLTIALGSIVLVGGFSFYMAREALVKARGQDLMAIVSGQKSNVIHVLNAWHDRVHLIASRTQLRLSFIEHLSDLDPDLLAIMERDLYDALASTHAVTWIELCDPEGRVVITAGTPVATEYKCDSFSAISSESVKIRSVWLDENDRLQVIMNGPLKLDGETIGILFVILDGQEILNITQNYNGLGRTGETFLAERKENGDAHFLVPLRHNPNRGLKHFIPSHRLDVPITQALLKREIIMPASNTLDYRDVPVFAATGYIPQQDWGIAVKIDRSEAMESIHTLFLTILKAALAIAGGAVFAGIYLSNSITKPILKLVEASEEVKAGNLSHKVDVKAKDETGILAGSFNDMLASLDEKTKALRKSEAQTRSVIDNMIDGLIVIDGYGTIEKFNRACEGIFGYKANEVTGQNIKMLMPDPYQSEHDGYLKNYRDSHQAKILGKPRELKAKHKDGTVFPIELSANEVITDDKNIFIGTIRDISARKEAEEEIMRSNEELERFAYIASHDLQEPLRMVVNFTGLLNEEYKDSMDEQARQYMTFSIDAARRMQDLVSDLLEYSRVGSEESGFETFNSGNKVKSALANLKDAIEETSAKIEMGDLPDIYANPIRFSRLTQNLIGNALKYRHEGRAPAIKISVEEEEAEWVFCISDNGLGIGEEYLEQIFVIFKRLHNKNEYAGTGIGLAICKKIVDSFGGRIWAESTEGAGSRFYFTVPKKDISENMG